MIDCSDHIRFNRINSSNIAVYIKSVTEYGDVGLSESRNGLRPNTVYIKPVYTSLWPNTGYNRIGQNELMEMIY